MIKLEVIIKEKDEENFNVQIKTPKDISKATEKEKNGASMVYNKICEALSNLENEK